MSDRAVVIVDTNVLLHAFPIDQIVWEDVVGCSDVLIVLVPQVIRELDDKKNSGSEKLKKRAQRLVQQLNGWFPPGATTKDARIADNVSLRLRAKEPKAIEGLDYDVFDDRIVGAAIEVRSEANVPVVIVTGDFIMRTKMEAQDFSVCNVPDRFLRREDDEPKPKISKSASISVGIVAGKEQLVSNRLVELGLSASELLEGAETELRSLRSGASKNNAMERVLAGVRQLSNEPSAEDLERWIERIKQYDEANASVIAFELVVANDGGGPADDVTARFTFPNRLYVFDTEPAWPARPRRFKMADELVAFRQPHPLDRKVRVEIEYDDEGRRCLKVQLDRLMQSTNYKVPLWANIDDEFATGFAIDAQALVASPALEVIQKLHIRFGDS